MGLLSHCSPDRKMRLSMRSHVKRFSASNFSRLPHGFPTDLMRSGAHTGFAPVCKHERSVRQAQLRPNGSLLFNAKLSRLILREASSSPSSGWLDESRGTIRSDRRARSRRLLKQPAQPRPGSQTVFCDCRCRGGFSCQGSSHSGYRAIT